jgi:4-hydroxy-tetrahydrodipicolinate synthase
MLKGSFVALVTPFKNNEIDYTALEELIDFHLANKTDGILFCGTTGESPSLAGDEKERLVRFGVKKIAGRVPVMVGTGSNNLNHTLAATAKARDWGADLALVITPYYNKPTQNGMYHYFAEIARQSSIPLVIYNVPGRTGINISAETTLKLAAEFDNIVAIKEASGDLVQVSEIVKAAPSGFSVLSGEDALNLAYMSCGAMGTVSVTANILPHQVHDLIQLALDGNYQAALKIHQQLLEINQNLFIETNPIPVKRALYKMGKISAELRLPLFKLSKANKEILDASLRDYNLI